jgi:ubiquinone/menaquinone biosynthesis C-methylase UbiE
VQRSGGFRSRGFAAALVAVACVGLTVAAPADYERKASASRGGTGKVYLGREIARVASADSIPRFERPQRQSEEQPERLIEALRLAGGETVADLGAGSGYYTFRLAKAVGPKGTVLAVEIQDEMLAALRKRAAELRATNVGLVRGRADDPRLPAGRLDLVLLVHVYHELEYPYEVMTKTVQALKPAGRIVIVEHRAEGSDASASPLHRMSEEQIVKEMEAVGLARLDTLDVAPSQHVLVFGRKEN